MKNTNTRSPRRNYRVAFKAKAALATLREDKTLAKFTGQSEINPNLIDHKEKLSLSRQSALLGIGWGSQFTA